MLENSSTCIIYTAGKVEYDYKIKGGKYILKILDEKVLKIDEEIEKLYKDCKYLCIIDGYDKLADNNGYLYCVGISEDSFDELIV